MVVRLVGDAQSYQRMLKEAAEQTKHATEVMKKASSGASTLGIGLGLVTKASLAAGAALGLLISGKEAFDAFAEAESISLKLNAALESNSRNVKEVRADYEDFAKALMKVTTAEDDATLQMLQVAESLGLTDIAAKRAVKNAVALAAAKGGEAAGYLRVTAALEQGATEILGRFLPALRSIEDPTERAMKAQEMLAKMFGVAKAEATSSAGQMKQLKNEFGNLAEEVGSVIAKIGLPVVRAVKMAVGAIQEWVDSIGGLGSVWDVVTDGASDAFGAVKEKAMAAWDWIKPVRDSLGSFWDMIVEAATTTWNAVSDAAAYTWDLIKVLAGDAWDEVGGGFIGFLTIVRDGLAEMLLMTEFFYRNFGAFADLAWTSTKLGFVIMANEIEHFFAETMPTLLTFFQDNWEDIFTDVWEFTKAIFTNIVDNVGNLFNKIVAAISGEDVDWSEGWKGMVDGFQRTTKELVLPERLKGQLEEELETLVSDQLDSLSQSYDEFREAKRKAFAVSEMLPPEETAKAGEDALDLGTKLTDAFKPPRKEAEKLKESYEAAVFGSAEALQRIERFQQAIARENKPSRGQPAEQREATQRGSPEANQRLEKQTKELEQIRKIAQAQLNKPSIVVEGANLG